MIGHGQMIGLASCIPSAGRIFRLVDIVVDTISVRNLKWLDDRNRFWVLW